jgi:hypothetical protein
MAEDAHIMWSRFRFTLVYLAIMLLVVIGFWRNEALSAEIKYNAEIGSYLNCQLNNETREVLLELIRNSPRVVREESDDWSEYLSKAEEELAQIDCPPEPSAP